MGRWFDKTDSLKTVKKHMGDRHTPHSIREAAKKEYWERRKKAGVSEEKIIDEIWELSI